MDGERVAELIEAGNDLAHWLRAWIEQYPEPRPCYSEAALARWADAKRAALAAVGRRP